MNKKTNIDNAKLVFEELEPRLLLSADGLGVLTEASVATLQTLVHSENENIIIVQHQTEQSFIVVHNKTQTDSRSELVIIDSRAPNFQQLHNDVIKAQQQGRDIHVVILDAHRDGIEQISEALDKYHKLDAVHIVSHGKDAQLQLGATQLNNQNLKQYNEEINKWNQVFTDGGDLLIYGCNLAGSANGTDLVNSLSTLTGADIAASDDVTGNNILGGDWDLEYQTGDIETSIAFTDDIQDNWQGTLNADALAAQQAALAEEQQNEEAQVQADQEAALIAESEAVLLAEEKEAEIIAQEPEQQAGIVEEQRQEIVFIDESVTDYQSFIDDLQNNSDKSTAFEIIVLDSATDGIEQISNVLSAYNDIDAIHIFSHGDDGTVKLGDTWLSADNIGEYSDSLNIWADALDENADILIYGCNLAESESGVQFVNQLATLTSADVAASDDLTGNTNLGGDWDLEYQQGNIETDIVVSADLQQNWNGILADTTTGLVAHYSFDIDAHDTSGNNNDGTLTNGALIDTTLATNQVGGGKLSLDGVNDTVNLTSHISEFSALTEGTISAWINTSAGTQSIFSVSDTSTDEDYATFRVKSTGELVFQVFDNATELLYVKSTATNLTDGNWHHVAVTVDSSGNNLYIDGVLASVTYQTGDSSTSDFLSAINGQDYASIGNIQESSGSIAEFGGNIDDVRVYNTALSGGTITALANPLVSNTYIVSTTADSGPGSLRQAILDANANDGAIDTISFNLDVSDANYLFYEDNGIAGQVTAGNETHTPGTVDSDFSKGWYRISLDSPLPNIEDTIIIDGTSQDGYTDSPIIQLDGSALSLAWEDGLLLTSTANNSIIKGLVVSNFPGDGIDVRGDSTVLQGNYVGTDVSGTIQQGNARGIIIASAADVQVGGIGAGEGNLISGNSTGLVIAGSSATGATVEGNLIGTDISGTLALGNTGAGIYFWGGANNNTIGGSDPASRNIISGNGQSGVLLEDAGTSNNTISGNYIGTDVTGTVDVGNNNNGILITAGAGTNTIGGAAAGESNIISGNNGDGIELSNSDDNVISGNYIGTNANGTADLGNTKWGIEVYFSSGNTIGGTTALERNVISGNDDSGIILYGAGTTNTVIQGNYIGTNATGTAAIANTNDGIIIETNASNNTVGGTTDGGRNILSGNGEDGVFISNDAFNNTVTGNYIGTDVTGTVALANARYGVTLYNGATGNTIGGATAGSGNVISANGSDGVVIDGAGGSATDNNIISGNYIGTDKDGTGNLGNTGEGINLFNGADNNTIGGTVAGAGNIVAYSGSDGIQLETTAGVGNAILGNSVFSNTGQAIDIAANGVLANDSGDGDTGANNLQNFPILSTATIDSGSLITIDGTFNSTASTTFRLEFFSNSVDDGNGEGETYLGFVNVTTDGSGNATYSTQLSATVVANSYISATATNLTTNDTSEFAQNIQAKPTISVSGASSAGAGQVYTLNLSAGAVMDSWVINWGDGTIETVVGDPSSVTHTYTVGADGLTYDILVSATDANGTYFENDLIASTSFLTGEGLYRYSDTGTFDQFFSGAELTNPYAMTIGPDGLLYVAGHTSDNIVRYNAETGAYVDTFVATGSGGLNAAAGLTFGPDGNFYVSNQIGDSILKYDGTTGSFLSTFVSTGSGGLNGPVSLSFQADGYLYVGSYNTDSVLRYDATTGAYFDTFVSAASGGLKGPGAIAWGADGNLYIASNDSTVKRYDVSTGAYIDNFVSTGSGGLSEATGLAFGPDGNLYVSSYASDQIIIYDGTTGALIGDYVTPGGDGLDGPVGITFAPSHQVLIVSNSAPTDLQTTATNNGGLSLNEDGGNDAYLIADNGGTIYAGLTATTMEVQFSSATPPVDGGDSDFVTYANGVTGSGNDLWYGVWRNDAGAGYQLGLGVNGGYQYATGFDASTLFDGEQHTVSVTWDSGNYEFFVDGVSVGSGSGFQSSHTITGGGELVFGMEQDSVGGGFQSDQVFQGTVYDVRIFNDARTAGEIAANYNQTLPNTEAGMIANWTFNDITTAGVVTDTVSGNNLTEQHAVGAGFTASTAELILAVAENAVNGTVIGSITAIDPDVGDSFTYSLLDDAGGRFVVNGSSGEITLATASLIDYETASTHNITVRVTDSGSLSYDEVFTVMVTDVNDAPIVDLNGTNDGGINFAASFLEGAGAVNVTDTDAIINDVDDTEFLQFGINLISFSDGANELVTIGGYTFSYGVTAVVVQTVGATDFEIDFDGSGFTISKDAGGNMPLADIQTLLQGITYENTLQDPTAGNRTIDIDIQDASGLMSATTTSTITVSAVNDAPTASATATDPTYTEGNAAVDLFSAVNVSTIESGQTIEQIVLTVTNVIDGANETINIDGSIVYLVNGDNDTTVSGYDYIVGIVGSTATITIDTVGTNVAAAQTLIDGLSYQNTSQDPTAASRVVTITSITDSGGGTDTSNPNITSTVNVVAVNDAPVITSDGGLATATINVAENQTAVTTVTATDADLDTLTYSISGGTDAALFSVDTNSGALTFNIAPDYEVPVDANVDNVYEVTVQVDDGNGGTDTQTINITVTNVNETPVATNDSYTIDEDNTLSIDWWDTDWTRRQQLSFDNLAQSETLTDVPVLIVLNASNVDYTQTNDDGSDLRFFAADGTPLAYEIEQWNEGGDSSVWVRVPQITGSSNSDSITMYYGNAAAASGETAGGVWDSNFVGVWHLNEEQAGTGGTDVYTDSTSHSNDGIDRVAAIGQEGKVTDGQEFGANDWIEIDHDPSLNLTDSMTISFWIKPTSDSGSFNRVVEKGLWGYNESYYFGGGDGTNDLTFYLNGQAVIDTVDNVLTVGVWQHAAVSYTSNGDGTGTARIYLDGTEIATGDYTNGVVAGNTGRLAIGHSDPLYDFDGFIDEVQISNTDRSADWIAAQYQAMNNALANEFVLFGGEQVAPVIDGVLTNDTDIDGDPVTVNTAPVVDVSNGTLAIKADGTFTYTPDANFNGTDSFTYEVSDGNGGTHQATVTITVTAVNDVPSGADKTVTATEDTDYVFTAADFGFTDNTDSPANIFLNVVIASAPTNGTLYLDADGDGNIDGGEALIATNVVSVADITAGKLKFAPATNVSGAGYDSFTFQVQDDGGVVNGGVNTDQSANTITIDVTAVNDVPVATGNTVIANEDVPLVIGVSDFSFTDVEGDSLASVTITGLNLNSETLTHTGGTVNVTNGMTITAAELADLTFTSALNDSTNSSFTYTVNDAGLGVSSAVMDITVNAGNDVPVATGNTVIASEDVPLVIGVSDFNFTDVEGDALNSVTITGLILNGGTLTHTGGTVNVTNGMTITVAELADLTFTSALNDSTNSSFTYTVNDAGLGVTSAVMNITVNAVNDVPVATGNTVVANENVPLVIGASDFNFTDVEGDSLASVTITGLNLNSGTLTHTSGTVNVTNGMTITAAQLADLTFTSALNDSTNSSFTYTVNDAGVGVTSAVMNITVNAVNDVPVATGNTVIANEDVPLVIGASDFSFTDVEGDALASVTITGLNINGGTLTHTGGTVNVTNGMTVTAAQLADLTFTSVLNDSTNSSFTYTVNDAGVGVTSAVMNITVNAVNDVPVAIGNTVVANEDVPLVINASDFSFTDVEGDSLALVTITGLNLNSGTLTHTGGTVNVTNGMTITSAELADLTFTSALNDSTNSSFSYTVNDAGLGITSAVMNITVNAVNDVPVATGNTVVANEDVPLIIGASDFSFTDVEGDSLASVTITGLNLNSGTLTHTGGTVNVTNGMTITAAELADLTFTSALNDSTNSSFAYTVNDAGLGITSAVMNITVNAVNDVPVATGNTVVANEDVPLIIGASDFSFTDVEGDSLASVTITGLNLNSGTLTHTGGTVNVTNGMTITAAELADLTFTSALNDSTNSSFAYTVNDAGLGITSAVMNITVNAVNDVPVATGNTVVANEDVPLVINASDFSFTDVEGDSLVSVTITGLNLNSGTLTHTGGTVNVTNGMTITAAELTDLTFTSALNDSTNSSFSYTVNDSGLGVTSAVMNITVNAVNDVPVATGNTVIANEDVPLIIGASDFSFTDVEGDSLASVTITGLTLNGGTLTHTGGTVNVANGMTVTAAQLADLTFTSALNDSTNSSFTYTVNDAGVGVTSAVMNITVNAVNDVPVATGNTVIANEDVPLVIGVSDFSFTDVEGDALASVTITGLTLNGGTLTHTGGSINVTNGMTVTAAELADLTFTSALNDSTNSSFTYTVNDAGIGVSSAVMNITVNAVNDVPVATGNTVIASEDVPLVIGVSDFNFTDVEGDALNSVTITGLTLNGGTLTHTGGTVNVTNGMTVTAAELADLTFTSALNNSTNSSFAYTVNDAGLGVTSAVMNITVNAVNDVPVATGNTVVANENVPLVIGVSDFNFTDVEGDSLSSVTITGLTLNGGTLTHTGGTVNVTNGMTITAAELADLTFTSALNDSTNSSFTYTVNDAGLGVTSAVMNITVNAVNDVPVATGNTVVANEDVPLIIGASDFSFTDVEGDSLASVTITGLTLNGGTLTHTGGTVNVANGMTVTAAQLADLTFTSALNDSTNSSFTYTVNDAGVGVTSAVMNITVNAVNDVPVAIVNTVTTTEDNAYSFVATDFTFTDVEGDSLVSATVTNLSLAGGTLTHSGGTVVSSGNTLTTAQLNTLIYTPLASTNGAPLATFDFTVNDAGVGAVTAQMDIDVTAVNDAPVATGNTVIANEDVPLVISAGDFNFTDVEGDSLASVTITGLTLNGGTLTHTGGTVNITNGMTVTAAQLADLTFTSALNDSTNSSFTYTVNDAGPGVTSAVMNITVNAVNDVPVATGNTVIANEDVPLVISAGDFNFTDVEGDSLTSVTITGLTLNGGTLTHTGGTVNVTNGMTVTAAQLADLTFTSALNDSTNSSFTYTVNDAGLGVTSAVMNITVNAVNDAPTAANNTVTTNEDTSYTFTAADFNYSDIDGDTLASIQITTLETVGALQLFGVDVILNQVITKADIDAGNLSFVPVANANGTGYDSFGFSVNDGIIDSVSSYSQTIDVTAANDAPTAANNTVTTNEDTPYTFTTADFNYSDIDGDTLANIQITTLETVGALQLSGVDVTLNQVITKAEIDAGNLSFAPVADANGVSYDSFNFSVNDGTTDSVSSYSQTIDVTAVNDAPTAANNTVTTNEDTIYTFTATDFNYSDIDGDTLANIKITSLETVGALQLSGVDVILNQVITKADIDAGNLSFVPVANANGTGYDSFSFSVNDGTVGSVSSYTQTIDVTAVNDAPTAANNTVTTNEDTIYIFTATDFNYSDIDGDTLANIKITSLETVGALQLSGVDVILNQVITKADIDAGNLSFVPVANANGTGYDSFSFSVNDGTTNSVSTYTQTVDVTAANDAPTAANNTVTTNEDTIYTFTAADFNYSDVELDTLASIKITSLETVGALQLSGVDVILNQVITKTDIDAGNLSFVPVANANGTGYDSFGFSVNDGTVDSVSSYSQTIDVTAVNDAPTALNDIPAAVNEGGTAIFDLAANDFDIDNALDLNSIAIISAPANGSLSINGDGTVTYIHDGSETVSDSFSYTIADITGAISNTASVTITVNPLNDAPSAIDDALTVNEGNTINIDLAANDVDVDNALDLNSIVIVGAPVNGSLTVNGNGSVDYTHNGSETGSDSFTYTITDISGAISNVATVNIVVNPVNDTPTTVGITNVTVLEDPVTSSTIDLNAAFDDADNAVSELTYTITGNTSIGLFDSAAVNAATGELVLDYAANMNGSSQISIRASDPSGAFIDTLFTVTVTPVNDAPVVMVNAGLIATDTSNTTITNAQLNVNDIDNTNAEIRYTITQLPANGELIINGVVATIGSGFSEDDLINNKVSYQSGGTGVNDQFGFTVSDGAGGSITGNSFNIVVQLAAVPAEEPVEPEVTIEPEKPEEQATTKVLITPVTRLAPTVEESFKPIGGSSTPQQQQPELTLEPVVEQEAVENPEEIVESYMAEEAPEVSKVDFSTARSVADVQIKSIAALWMAIDEMKQEMSENVTENISEIEFRAAAISSSGVVLTAGVVAWVLRSGALMASLISTIPLWKGYDPLPLLVYKNDEEKEIITEDKIPTSLEELKKVKALKEKMQKQMKVDRLFGHAGIGE